MGGIRKSFRYVIDITGPDLISLGEFEGISSSLRVQE